MERRYWKDIEYGYKRWKRLQKQNKGIDKDAILLITYPINQSQRDRGRKYLKILSIRYLQYNS